MGSGVSYSNIFLKCGVKQLALLLNFSELYKMIYSKNLSELDEIP